MTEAGAPDSRRPPRVVVTRLLGAAAALAAAVLAVVGSFLPLVSGRLDQRGAAVFTLSITGWKLNGQSPSGAPVSTSGGAAQNGIPLTIAAALLLVVALLILVAAPRFAPTVLRSTAVAGGAVVVAFFVGILLTIGIQAGNLLGTLRPVGAAVGNDSFATSADLGAGFWLEVVAGVLAIAAVALAALSPRAFTTPPGESST